MSLNFETVSLKTLLSSYKRLFLEIQVIYLRKKVRTISFRHITVLLIRITYHLLF